MDTDVVFLVSALCTVGCVLCAVGHALCAVSAALCAVSRVLCAVALSAIIVLPCPGGYCFLIITCFHSLLLGTWEQAVTVKTD